MMVKCGRQEWTSTKGGGGSTAVPDVINVSAETVKIKVSDANHAG
jgi:hypothetical protein